MIHYIIVAYDSYQHITKFISKIHCQLEIDCVIHVADNTNNPRIGEFCLDNRIVYYPLLNLGYGRAINFVLKHINILPDSLFFFSNDDIELLSDNTLALFIEHYHNIKLYQQNIGPLAPLYVNDEGNIDERFNDNQCYVTKNVSSIDFAPAALWLVDGHFLENVGGFFPMFFMYGEDRELGYRWNAYNYQAYIAKDILVQHTFKYPPEDYNLFREMEYNTLVAFYLCLHHKVLQFHYFVIKSLIGAIYHIQVRRFFYILLGYFRYIVNRKVFKQYKSDLNNKVNFRYLK